MGVGFDHYSPIGPCKSLIIHEYSSEITHLDLTFGFLLAPRAGRGVGPLALRAGRGVGLLAALLALATVSVARAATPPPLRAAHAAVASDDGLASAAGVAALKAGGNAVDAACAVALVLGVVEPEASGIGGGGFALVHLAKQRKTVALDFRERAPTAIASALYFKDGKLQPELSKRGGLAVAVPGEVRGLEDMVRRFGALPFARCVEPAARIAARGFPISWRLAESLAGLDHKQADGNPAFVKAFASKNFAEGEILRRPELARTLDKLRRGGADAFYKGEIAAAIVEAVRATGGVMTAGDLADYKVTERAPLETRYRGLRVVSMPPPSSGGIALVEALGVIAARAPTPEELTRDGRGSSAALHLTAEALKHAFADRARYLGDPDFVKVDVAHLADPAYHAALAKRIKPDLVLVHDLYGTPGPPPTEHKDGGTTHLSVIDADGNAVSLTTTVNLGFGAHLVAGATGIVLNDQMDDFSIQPGVPNAFGLVGSEQNAVAPGKRPLSSMTPTIVFDGDDRVRVVVGAAGGPTIISATMEVLENVVDWKLDAQAAVAAPRIHAQWTPDIVGVEADIPRDVLVGLEKRGHKTRVFPHIGTANVLVRTEAGIEAGAEPRSPSQPAGY